MKIRVMRRHIKEGIRTSRFKCPIALAFNEETGGVADVHRHTLWDVSDFYDLPRSAQRFIRSFDQGKPVKPFSFTLKA